MSVQILGADGVTVLSTVNVGASKGAALMLPVRSDGSEIEPVFAGEYYMSFSQRFTSALAANAGLFALRNGASRTLKFLNILANLSFDGTAAASEFVLIGQRFTSASVTPTGGTGLGGATGLLGSPAFAEVPESMGAASSSIADARYAAAGTALTTTGIVTTSPVLSMTLSRGVTGGSISQGWSRDLELAPNEGIIFSYGAPGVIGDALALTLYYGTF